MPFFFFPGRGHNYLLYLLMDSSSILLGTNNERSFSLSKLFPVLLPYTLNIMFSLHLYSIRLILWHHSDFLNKDLRKELIFLVQALT